MVVSDYISIVGLSSILQETSSWNIFLFLGVETLFWAVLSLFFLFFIPKEYKIHKKSIFFFFLVINVGLLFMGIVITLVMLLFGFRMATSKVFKPKYGMINFEEYTSSFPVINSKFHEGVLAIGGEKQRLISSNEKIKSLKILYDSNAQGNIEKIKLFLADSSDETRLYAFALVSAAEKRLNSHIKELRDKIDKCADKGKLEGHYFNLAQTYWQFVFHGVANEYLVGFYTEKIEDTLHKISHKSNASILLGKIHLFNHKYIEAEESFREAITLGASLESVSTFLAESKYGQRAFNSVSEYILQEEFSIDLRMKPLYEVWKSEKRGA